MERGRRCRLLARGSRRTPRHLPQNLPSYLVEKVSTFSLVVIHNLEDCIANILEDCSYERLAGIIERDTIGIWTQRSAKPIPFHWNSGANFRRRKETLEFCRRYLLGSTKDYSNGKYSEGSLNEKLSKNIQNVDVATGWTDSFALEVHSLLRTKRTEATKFRRDYHSGPSNAIRIQDQSNCKYVRNTNPTRSPIESGSCQNSGLNFGRTKLSP